ncbi:MAG TPA: ATP-binding protein, partial [Chitinophagaceae bacterium]|nr:ATP-binding protein [Chitinophagaceae bacterium]
VRDITDRKKAEEKKATLLNELAKVNRELETFNYSVSHDLKSPLRTITNFLQIFLKKYGTKQEEEANYLLDIINRKTQKMGELIDDLLNFSRLGKKDLDIYFINMNQLITHVIEEQKHLNSHSLEIKYDKLDNCYGDNVLLQQVWDNLISNAIKYSQTRKKQYIEIGSFRKDDEIIYWIKDNGVGFDMQYASKLFEVFQRLHDKSEFEGTGIGLALAKRIIEKHGGRIWAEGKVDEGSVFYFSIPANGIVPGKNDY